MVIEAGWISISICGEGGINIVRPCTSTSVPMCSVPRA